MKAKITFENEDGAKGIVHVDLQETEEGYVATVEGKFMEDPADQEDDMYAQLMMSLVDHLQQEGSKTEILEIVKF